jgi:hypothetical protein
MCMRKHFLINGLLVECFKTRRISTYCCLYSDRFIGEEAKAVKNPS